MDSTKTSNCMPYQTFTRRLTNRSVIFVCIIAILSVLFTDQSAAQSIFTSTLNTTGSAKKLPANDARFPSYSFEWNVGESTIVTTNSNGNLMVTHGLLQGFLLKEPVVPAARSWFPDEIVIFPNPAVDDFTVELLTGIQGDIVFTLYNNQGTPLHQRSVRYQGLGSTQHFMIRHLPAGTYFLRISAKGLPENGGYITKQGTFKIIKAQ